MLAQAFDAIENSIKALITNKVNRVIMIFLCMPIKCTSKQISLSGIRYVTNKYNHNYSKASNNAFQNILI